MHCCLLILCLVRIAFHADAGDQAENSMQLSSEPDMHISTQMKENKLEQK
jgi:hypothetical protein